MWIRTLNVVSLIADAGHLHNHITCPILIVKARLTICCSSYTCFTDRTTRFTQPITVIQQIKAI